MVFFIYNCIFAIINSMYSEKHCFYNKNQFTNYIWDSLALFKSLSRISIALVFNDTGFLLI